MAQFRTSNDLVSSVLRRCGENTDGTSPYATQAIDYLNQIHHTVITGGSEFNLEVDEPWVWARAKRPLVIEVQPSYSTGSVTLTQGSEAGSFSSGPAASLAGYFLRLDNGPEVYKIVSHTAAATAFEIDGAFPGTSIAGATYKAFLLDYDLIAPYIVIDSENDKLDFIVSGTTVLTATLTQGSYTPADLATHVAARLIVADSARAYTCTYDTGTRLFTVGSNLVSSAIFKPQGASTNSYRSGWATLGFDYENLASAASQVSVYPHSAIIRLTEPARCYYGTGDCAVTGMDPLALDRDYPLAALEPGVPTQFAVIREKNDGTLTVRFNKYPSVKSRVEFEIVPSPKDLKASAYSIPLIPRKFIRILEYGAAFYILTDKRDSKADKYFQIAQATLSAMMRQNRKELMRVGRNFGQVVPRPDLVPDNKNFRLNNYGYSVGTD